MLKMSNVPQITKKSKIIAWIFKNTLVNELDALGHFRIYSDFTGETRRKKCWKSIYSHLHLLSRSYMT